MYRKLLTLGTWLLGIGLIGLGIHALLDPSAASQGYGVLLGDDNPGYIIAAGMRDLALGLATIGVQLRQRKALPFLLAPMLVIPLADVGLVLKYGEATMLGVAPHAVGVVGICVLLVLSLREKHR